MGLAVDGANRHDMKLVRVTVDSLPISRPAPSPEHPQGLCLDKGYDFAEVRRIVDEFGFTAHIRSRGEEAQAIKREGRIQSQALGGGTHSQLAEPIPAHPGALGQVSRQLHRLSSFRLRPHRPQSCRVIRIGTKARGAKKTPKPHHNQGERQNGPIQDQYAQNAVSRGPSAHHANAPLHGTDRETTTRSNATFRSRR